MKTKTLIKNIQPKIDAACDAFTLAFKALREANELAGRERCTLRNLKYRELIDLSKLEDLLGDRGWNSSTVYC